MKISLKTHSGNYLTAVGGGGLGDPAGMPFNSVPLHTNATEAKDWELFTAEPLGGNTFALRTSSGHYLTAVNGGGIGDPSGLSFNSIPFHTNATEVKDWETFEMVPISEDQKTFALRTASGNFITAVNGGGMGDPAGQPFNSWPMHTNATEAKDWEKFEINPVVTGNRKRSLFSDAQAYIPTATQLGGQFDAFSNTYKDSIAAIKTAVMQTKTMDATTRQHLQNLAQSSFVQTAKNSHQRSVATTLSFGFSAEGGFIIGGAIAAGIAFDTSFTRYMFYETLSGSLGATAGGSIDFRFGAYAFDVFSFDGFSDSVELDAGAVVGVGIAGIYNWWDGPGVELAFGVGLEFSAAFTLGYSSDSGRGYL